MANVLMTICQLNRDQNTYNLLQLPTISCQKVSFDALFADFRLDKLTIIFITMKSETLHFLEKETGNNICEIDEAVILQCVIISEQNCI